MALELAMVDEGDWETGAGIINWGFCFQVVPLHLGHQASVISIETLSAINTPLKHNITSMYSIFRQLNANPSPWGLGDSSACTDTSVSWGTRNDDLLPQRTRSLLHLLLLLVL